VTVSAPVERPRILARLAEQPGQTAYELAAALGYGKPESRRVAEIVKRLHQQGALVAGSEFRPTMGRPAQVYYLAPPGTPPPPRRTESPAQTEERRRRARAKQAQRRARLAGQTITPELAARPRLHLPPPPPAWQMPGDPACTGAAPGLFFGPDRESPADRGRRVKQARVLCDACPVRDECLDGARARGERYGIWGGIDLENERALRAVQATRPAVAAAGRA
jgi:WhiB family redox-sensing transcriptional regulator